MFKNRSVQMKIVKDTESDQPQTPRITPTELTASALMTVREISRSAAVLVGTYVAADTVRRIAVHVVATKIS